MLGINIGANKESSDRVADYVAGIRAFADIADYFTINVSSPNTPNLRDLQEPEALDDLLARVLEARSDADGSLTAKPILLKIAPDLSLAQLDGIVRVVRRRRLDGMIVSNTTVARPPSIATGRYGSEAGGLSGRPLFDLSTRMLAEVFIRVEGQFPLVGVGGIDGPEAAIAKIEAGASLLQLYSALVFHGPALVGAINAALTKMGNTAGQPWDRVGCAARDWSRRQPS